MKKKSLTFLFYLISWCVSQQVLAQKLPAGSFGHQVVFELALSDSLRVLGYNNMSYGVSDNAFEGTKYHPLRDGGNIKSPIMLGVKLNPLLTNYHLSDVKSFSKNYSAYRISDGSDATLYALGITKKNVEDYRYRVVVNDSLEVVHWSKIKLVNTNPSYDDYGALGNFNYPDKQILVEVVNINNYQIRDGVIFDWRKNLKPILANIRFQSPIRRGGKMDPYAYMNKEAAHYIKYDPVTKAPTEISFFADSVYFINLIFKDHEAISYSAKLYKISNKKEEYSGDAEGGSLGSEFKFDFTNYQNGDYEIIISPRGSTGFYMQDQQLHIKLKILPNPASGKKASLKELLPYLVAALLLIGLLFWLYRRRVNIKLARSVQAKQNVNLKMRSIRAQLNPHFMFNALTSIQNLVNKKDMEGANHYLSRFAGLTRKVLNTGEKELISLEDELKILDDYLQMEQLRFGFNYHIDAQPEINLANIEVPAMLLQPFAENAIKHGVADLRERGQVNVTINKNNNNLNLTITDNGLGFNQAAQAGADGSFGLKLSGERIELLNQIYPGNPVSLDIKTGTEGTTVTVTLANWIS